MHVGSCSNVLHRKAANFPLHPHFSPLGNIEEPQVCGVGARNGSEMKGIPGQHFNLCLQSIEYRRGQSPQVCVLALPGLKKKHFISCQHLIWRFHKEEHISSLSRKIRSSSWSRVLVLAGFSWACPSLTLEEGPMGFQAWASEVAECEHRSHKSQLHHKSSVPASLSLSLPRPQSPHL